MTACLVVEPISTACAASDAIYAAAYSELRRLARRERRRAGEPSTLDTTALVHEAWIKLNAGTALAGLPQIEFRAIAARAMRNVLIDHARRLDAAKRRHLTVTLSHADAEAITTPVALLDLDDALRELED
ncbi:MAG: hypothetical protein JSS28_03525, partial [Proteobacteria bacterium]|nr:hypothetical protein [Pseudomonadota bacterium]